MLPVNFNQLYYFWAVARAGSLSAARKVLLLTQPTLSLQIQQLERSLGRRLFDRGRQGVTLTPDGRRAFEHCEIMFRRGEDMLSAVKGGPGAGVVRFRLGVASSVPREKIVRVMRDVSALQQEVAMRILSGSLEDLQSRLLRHMTDILISDVDPAVNLGRDFRSRLVRREPLFFVCAAGRRPRGRFPAALGEAPLLLRTPENPIRKEVDHFLYRARLAPAIAAETDDSELLKDLLLRGRGVAALSPSAVKRELSSGRVVRLHREPVGLWENTWFCARRRTHSDPRLQPILDKLMGEYELV